MERNRVSQTIYTTLKESCKRTIKEESGAPEIIYTSCYSTLNVWTSRKDAMDFYEECLYGSEGSERERYTNIYFDLKSGEDFATDGDDDYIRDIAWMGKPVNGWASPVSKQELEGRNSAEQVVAQIKSGKIMPPKEFLNILGEGISITKSMNESLETSTKVKDCADSVDICMALEGETLMIEDMEDWNRVKSVAESLSRSQGFYGRLLAQMNEFEEAGELEFPIYI
jgi:hypothetical protein